MTLKSTITAALLSLCMVSPALAAPPSGPYSDSSRGFHRSAWELIGTREVSFRTERDFIPVRGYDRHRQIMICVYRQPVRVFDLDVRFSNGGHQDVNIRHVIGEGQCTRAIDLHGRHRDIRAIAMTYKSIGGHRFEAGYGDRYSGRRHVQTAIVKVFAR